MGARRDLAAVFVVAGRYCSTCPAAHADAEAAGATSNAASDAPAEDHLAEIVVTAQKRAEPINSVGLTIQAAGGAINYDYADKSAGQDVEPL